jgi:hypothetical protein
MFNRRDDTRKPLERQDFYFGRRNLAVTKSAAIREMSAVRK